LYFAFVLAAAGERLWKNRSAEPAGCVRDVTLNGEPLKAGTIEFSPVANGTSSGASISNGEYSVPQAKGLPAGEYIVRISANDATEQPIEVPGESNKISKELIPNTYNTKSTVRFQVDNTKENVFDLNVETKK
jgi:hypothetical protein